MTNTTLNNNNSSTASVSNPRSAKVHLFSGISSLVDANRMTDFQGCQIGDDAATAVPGVLRTLPSSKSNNRCPSCNAVVYSRRHPLCGVCGEQLPSDLLFSAAERAQLNQMLNGERSRHRAWLKRREVGSGRLSF